MVNLNPHFVLVPINTRIMPLFVHAVYSGGNFHTHVLLPFRLIPLSAYLQHEDILCDPDRGVRATSSFCVPRAQIVHQKILVRHQNDRHHRHGIPAGALRLPGAHGPRSSAR